MSAGAGASVQSPDPFGALKALRGVRGNRCEGHCQQCHGALQYVHVVDPADGFDWGNFYYCEAAIADDRAAGFTVTEAK